MLYDHRTQVVPLVIGLREYIQTLTEVIRIDVGDGTLMAAVKGLLGGQVCGVVPCPPAARQHLGLGLGQGLRRRATPRRPRSSPRRRPARPPAAPTRVTDLLRRVLGRMIRVAIKFGIFVVVCLFFTGYLAFTIGNLNVRDPLGHDTYRISATFDDVTGLIPDDNVKVAGVVIGKVTSVKVEGGKAVVEMAIHNDHDNIPKVGTSAAIRWRNLIGQRYVYLYPGTPGGEALQNGDTIASTTSVVDLGALFEKLGPIVTAIDPSQVNDLLDTLTQALDGREDKVGSGPGRPGHAGPRPVQPRRRHPAPGHQPERRRRHAQPPRRRDRHDDPEPHQPGHTRSGTTRPPSTRRSRRWASSAPTSTGCSPTTPASSTPSSTNLAKITDTVKGRLPQLDQFLSGFAEASSAIFRAGDRGEFLNQKILCAAVGPPASSVDGLPHPAGDQGPLVLLGQTYQPPPVTGAGAITSLFDKAVGP